MSIHSDQGRHYESQVFQELCEILKIRKTRTTPRNPKCNGQVQRFNRSLLLGREIRLPYAITRKGHDPHRSDTTLTSGAHALKIKERLHRPHHMARKHLEVNMKRRKDHYDIKSNLMSYKVFDKVWYLNDIRKEGLCAKLQPSCIGTYVVTKKLSDLNYEIQIDSKGS